MTFIILIIVAWLLGFLLGIPTVKYVSNRSPTASIMVLLPAIILNFFSTNHPLISDIRYFFFYLGIGIISYWVYHDKTKK
jgi:hypothetical protein